MWWGVVMSEGINVKKNFVFIKLSNCNRFKIVMFC